MCDHVSVPWTFEPGEAPPAFLCYHENDAALMQKQWGFLDCLSPAGFEEMYNMGFEYAKGLTESGRLELRRRDVPKMPTPTSALTTPSIAPSPARVESNVDLARVVAPAINV